MKSIKFLLLILLAALVLSACQSAASTSGSGQSSGDYPAPAENIPVAPGSYPEPQQDQAPVPNSVLYPGIDDGEEIAWSQAIGMIKNNEIQKITKAESQRLILILKDGRSLIVIEPVTGELERVIELCGDLCKDIPIITE